MWALARRALFSLFVVAGLVGLSLARLARVPRPKARVVARYLQGVVSVERVSLRGRTVGYSTRCAGRVVFERFGEHPPHARESPGVLALSERGCALTIRVPGCRIERTGGCERR